MRRVLSIILFVLGGWMLSSESMMGSFDFAQGVGVQLAMVGFMAAFAAPFLALGTWASPGNRFAELGLTLMIVAGVGAFIALTMFVVTHDPGFKQLMPPDQPMPEFHFTPVFAAANLLVVGGGGYLLRRWAVKRAHDERPELERIFGDE
jgi:cation transport ATPase